jgi:uncharacterized protein
MKTRQHINNLDIESFEKGKLHKVWFDVVTDTLGEPISIPILIGRGSKPGPVLGVTAAIHGNEINGISVIQKLFNELGGETVKGTIIGVPVVNMPAFQRNQRVFIDNIDLNHIMPGKADGSVSDVYAYNFFTKIASKFDFLIDLHTASGGRVNSYYIRADMKDKVTKKMALLQNAQIIVHNPPSDGTLRGACSDLGIPSVTLEVGNPSTFQKGIIRSTITGLHNVLIDFGMLEGEIDYDNTKPVMCKESFWIYTDTGGLLSVKPKITEVVKKGQLIATQVDIFGEKIREYFAPQKGIVIGHSVNPINQSGGRILHLGVLK